MEERVPPSEGQNHNEVLIATDGSLSSKIAATLASQIAEFQHLKIKGLYVINEHYIYNNYTDIQPEIGPVDPLPTRSGLADLLKLRGEMAMDWLETLCRSMNVPFEYEIVYGYVADEIINQSLNAPLVAFGKKGFHQPKEPSHLGENFHQFIHRIRVPFIAGDVELRPVRTILLGYNGSQSAERALGWAKTLTQAFQARLLVAYVMDGEQTPDQVEAMEQSAHANGLEDFEWLALQGKPADQLASVIYQNDVDLLIVGGFQHPALTHWLKSSPLDQLLKSTRVTTLVG